MGVPSVSTFSLPAEVTLLGHQMFEADVYKEVIVTDVVLGSISDESSSTNAAEVDISNNKISVANSDESPTARTTESDISDDKISVSSREVPRKGQNCSGSHLEQRYDKGELRTILL
ncbi:hypothetical protein QAD02_002629 [Eretmocerus hayati]|uniref:Uncharacterized protein n=1 Tax=Eretmocerus hayati TaxID=131215 RepID=A0ACC2NPB6_9HYME|nr:hypothetical protein QAD02_002629 [Eretmocerus hayati]